MAVLAVNTTWHTITIITDIAQDFFPNKTRSRGWNLNVFIWNRHVLDHITTAGQKMIKDQGTVHTRGMTFAPGACVCVCDCTLIVAEYLIHICFSALALTQLACSSPTLLPPAHIYTHPGVARNYALPSEFCH